MLRIGTSRKSGRGVFATVDLPRGTAFNYYGVVVEDEEGLDPEYCMGLEFINENGEIEELEGFVGDGHPNVLKEEHLYIASCINEATEEEELNCLFRSHPDLDETDLMRSYAEEIPVAIVLCVLTRDVKAGEEILTHYGNCYMRHGYEVNFDVEAAASDVEEDMAEDDV